MPDVGRVPADGAESFDLTARPWIPVLDLDGTQEELSLGAVFTRAGRLRRIVGDVPTQEFALLRLMLAVAHDALGGPRDIEDWADLWADEDCLAPVTKYLDAHRERFDLLHPAAPFFQTAGLRTARDEVFSLNRIVADVPNGEPFFTSRMPAVGRLGFAEAARWVVHAHAYDTSGIKTGVVGDDRTRGGRVYPLGVGWSGALGGVFVEGRTLRETLLLNLVAADTTGLRIDEDDRPAWRREPCGPGPVPGRRPSGVRDLYTWQTRRIRLAFDDSGVHGVVLGYGDPLDPHNLHTREPMTGWRRSPAQEKKHGKAPVYLPRGHDPSRAVWRGLSSLIAEQQATDRSGEPAPHLRPTVLEWVSRLVTEGVLRRGLLIRARVVGAVYGTQQSVIDDIVDDRLAMDVVLLHRRDRAYAQQAIDAVGDAERAVTVLGGLATDLARAVGADDEGPRARARESGFAAMDNPYRIWLRELAAAADPEEERARWKRDVHAIVGRLGRQLLAGAGDPAWGGRTADTSEGSVWINSASADQWFRRNLNRALGRPASAEGDNGEGPAPAAGPPRSPADDLPTAPAGAAAESRSRKGTFVTTATHHPLPDRVRRIVAENVDELQWGYLDDRPHAVAVLARLRRGAGKEPQQVPDLLGLIDTDALYDAVAEGGRRPGEADLTRAEDAVHVALTLWALHQQSQGTGMHRPDSRNSPAGLGAAVRRLMAEEEGGRTAGKEKKERIDDAVLKRFVRAGSAPDLPALSQRLREIVLLLRREGIPLDYALLAGQLYRWQKSGGREAVRREWGRSFHSYRAPGSPGGDTGPGPGGPAGSAPAAGVPSDSGLPSDSDTTFKDAS